MTVHRLVLLRHGQSTWNRDNRFTGWTDVGLSELGVAEAVAAGRRLKAEGFAFDVVFQSSLKRAIKTTWLVLEEMDLMWIPIHGDWRLNERHYGALQGLDKSETAARHGEGQVRIWRRSYDVRPPALAADDPRHPSRDPRYAGLDPRALPLTESLEDVVRRLIPLWRETIAPAIRHGQRVLISAHGNSLRALVKHLDDVPESEIVDLEIPTGIPLVYELDGDLRPLRHHSLGERRTGGAPGSST